MFCRYCPVCVFPVWRISVHNRHLYIHKNKLSAVAVRPCLASILRGSIGQAYALADGFEQNRLVGVSSTSKAHFFSSVRGKITLYSSDI